MDLEPGTSSRRSPASEPRDAATAPETLAENASRLAFHALSQLLSVVIHDLANPLQTITMQLELLDDPIGESSRSRIDSILDTSEEFVALLGNLSTFVQRKPTPSDTCQARDTLHRVEALLQARLLRRGLTWSTELVDLPQIPHGCTVLELLLLRILLQVAYGHHRGHRSSQALRLKMMLKSPLVAGQSAKLRLHFSMRDSSSKTVPLLSPQQQSQLRADLQTLSPNYAVTSLANHSLVLDLDLAPPTDR